LFKKLLLLFSACFLFAKTIDVDINAKNHRDCKGNVRYYTSLKDALNYASSGDTIEICPGEYNEGEILLNKDNLTITSTTGNPDDVIISHSDDYIFYTKSVISNLTIKNITIKQKKSSKRVFLLNNGGDHITLKNLKIYSAGYGFYFDDYIDTLDIENVISNTKSSFLYSGNNIENFTFKNNSVEAGDYGIYNKSNLLGTTIFEDSNITSGNDSIYVKNQINNSVFKNMVIESKSYKGIEVNTFYQDSGAVEFQNVKITSKKEGILVKSRVLDDIVLENVEINSGDDGIYIKTSADKVYLKDSTIYAGSSGVGFYAGQIYTYFEIEHNSFLSGKRGIHINGGGADGKILNNLIKDLSEYGLKLSVNGSVYIKENCFVDNAKQAYVNDHDAKIDGNCWSDYDEDKGGAYKVPPIPLYDMHPKKSGCNCGDSDSSQPPNSNKTSLFNVIDYINESSCNAKKNWDNPITTKFVNDEFKLTLLSKDEEDNPINADIKKVKFYFYDSGDNSKCSGKLLGVQEVCNDCGTTNENGCLSLENIKISKAVKCVEVYIEGKASDNESDDVNKSVSLDNFAVIPYRFLIGKTQAKAGEEFELDIKAVDKNNHPVKDYNETVTINGNSPLIEYKEIKSGCVTGELKKISGSFKDGIAKVKFKYSDIGEVNITIKEKNNEFAKVDSDDTSNRFIKSDSNLSSFFVHHFKVSAELKDYDTFTYVDDSYNILAKILLDIIAQNNDNNELKNYTSSCYANNVEVNITLNSVPYSKVLFIFNGVKRVSSVNNFDFNITKDNFVKNEINMPVLFNFNRNSSVAVNPFDVEIKNISIKDKNTNLTTSKITGKAKFLYGRLFCKDITANSDLFSNTCQIGFYDNKNRHEKEIIYYWWLNLAHSAKDGNVSSNEIKILKSFKVNNDKVDLNLNRINLANGQITFLFSKKNNFPLAVVHLLSRNLQWLWYSKYNEKYDISNTSTCKNHYCFSIVSSYNNSSKGAIKSGKEIKGPEANVTAPPLGIKIFR
jgi:hypothetical protein